MRKMIITAIAVFVLVAAFMLPLGAKAQEIRVERPLDPLRLHYALVKAENWDGHSIGRHGEMGELQLKPYNFEKYRNRPVTYCISLLEACKRVGMAPTIFTAALIHNAGATAVKQGTYTEAQWDFASRARNIYYDRTQ